MAGLHIEPGALRVVGNTGLGTGPSATRRLTVSGAGETGVSDSGDKAASVLVSSTGGGAGSGGSIEFGFGYGTYTQPYFAAIKGHGTNGASSTAGDLVVLTRAAATDAALTERLRVGTAGVAVSGTLDVSGRVQSAAQPGFLARKTSNQSSVTNGTDLTFDSEVSDVGGVFSSPTFTAPVAGAYLLFGSIAIYNTSGSDVTNTGVIASINGEAWYLATLPALANGERATLPVSLVVPLGASDAVKLQYVGVGGAVTVEGLNTSTRLTFWGMRLLA